MTLSERVGLVRDVRSGEVRSKSANWWGFGGQMRRKPGTDAPESVEIGLRSAPIEPVRPYWEQVEGPKGVVPWKWVKGNSYPFFFWLELARGSSRELFDRAVAEKVAFVPGAAFYPGGDEQIGEIHTGDRFARLCFTFADDAAIDEGCRRLSAALG